MNLYEFIKSKQNDYDTYDDVYDAVVTVCYIDEEDETDNYDKFCNGIIKLVEVVKETNVGVIVKWTDLITRNMDKFKAFAYKYWIDTYEDDDDEFIYQWINEINSYLAGYVSLEFYNNLVKLIDTLI